MGEIVLYSRLHQLARYFVRTANDVSEYYAVLRTILLDPMFPPIVGGRCIELADELALPKDMRTQDFFIELFRNIREACRPETFVWVETQPNYVMESLQQLLTTELDQLFHGPSSMGFENPGQINFMYKIYSYLVVNRQYFTRREEKVQHVPHPWQAHV